MSFKKQFLELEVELYRCRVFVYSAGIFPERLTRCLLSPAAGRAPFLPLGRPGARETLSQGQGQTSKSLVGWLGALIKERESKRGKGKLWLTPARLTMVVFASLSFLTAQEWPEVWSEALEIDPEVIPWGRPQGPLATLPRAPLPGSVFCHVKDPDWYLPVKTISSHYPISPRSFSSNSSFFQKKKKEKKE